MIYAALGGHTKSAAVLLRRGATVNKPGCRRRTALMLAAREGYLEIVRMLLTAGADVDTRSEWGETALSLAQKHEHSEKHSLIVGLLKQYGAPD